MAWKKSEGKEKYKAALEGRKIPVLTLDHKWHQLFTRTGTNSLIRSLEERLNQLLRRQGKLNDELKKLKAMKKKLMGEIVSSMDDTGNKNTEKMRMENKRLIEECNEKMESCQDELLELPGDIDAANYKLMLATMDVCYDRLQKNTKEIEAIDKWITQTRIELKKRVLKKQDAEIANHELYSYMHDIFGSEVIEIFDMKYDPSEKKQTGGNEEKSK